MIEYTRAAERDLRGLSKRDVAAIVDAIVKFDTSDVGDVKKLRDQRPPMWRLRSGDFRVLFRRVDGVMRIERVLDRRDAYR